MAYWPVVSNPLDYISWASPSGYLRGPMNSNPTPYVTRYVGDSLDFPKLPSILEYTTCLSNTEFNLFWACVWGIAGEIGGQTNIHAGVHGFAGGVWTSKDNKFCMGDFEDPITSPNDPLWFSHHSQLERLYYTWRQLTGDKLATTSDPCGIFYGRSVTNPQPAGHNLNDLFYPYFYLGGDTPITLAQACSYLNTNNVDYTYL
eukprot:gene18954-24762_t